MIRASAPGKLMIAGEYTVVIPGGPALAVAIDRRVTVTIEPGGDRWRVTSEAMGLHEADPEQVPVLSAALNAVEGLPDAAHITVDSELGIGPQKPGLGASAAVTVATLGALKGLAGLEPPTLAEAIAVHREAQGGKGSGYDVATSLMGGVCLFDSAAEPATVTHVEWPAGLKARVFFTGHGASTVALLERVFGWREEDVDDMESYLVPLMQETRELIEAWGTNDVSRILTAIAQAQEELDAFDRAGEIGVYAGGQMQLLAAIEDVGAIGRTSGAGGGDCVWAFAHGTDELERAQQSAGLLGFDRIDVKWPAEGLVLEHNDDT